MSVISQKPPKNYLYQVGLGNLIDFAVVAASQTAPVTNGNLQSVTVPGQSFFQDGQKVSILALGNSTAHGASSITWNLLLNGVVIFTGTIGANGNTRGFVGRFEFLRRNVTTLLFNGQIEFNMETAVSAIVGTIQGTTRVLTGLDLTTDSVFQVQVTDAAGAEVITQDGMFAWII
jgi:hypothetical protein